MRIRLSSLAHDVDRRVGHQFAGAEHMAYAAGGQFEDAGGIINALPEAFVPVLQM